MRRIARRSLPFGLTAAVALPLLLPAAGQSAGPAADAKVQRGLERLVAAPGGPPGAIATLYRDGKTTVLRAGRADVRRRGRRARPTTCGSPASPRRSAARSR